ncbi:DUF4232 domain-containing protein [Streptomyces sp. NBC_01239]|uniref:DUF4232 domain-containing protein n=1 Tax=Streptomyces sp. NBC_01239 TaxID=2903792 RepID=UPI002256F371|nr:DUF4232 domain-containing protein [Streptomyces sp. NBC_01239]MCX4815039.1 DUF4232 domain-containing protein [Streptomyces sp. NBC_01239]
MSSTLFRRRTALLTAGFAAAASLALTACGTGENTGAQHTPNTAADTRAAASGTDSVVTVAKSNRSTTTSKTATASKGTKASSAAVTCTGANTKVTAQTVTRPLNHMLLTVKNTGSTTCYLYGYPALRFQDAQAVPPVVEDSQPQAVTTLRPGQSGYAGVNLSSADGSGTGGYTAKTLSVIFQNRDLDFIGSGVKVPLPSKGTYIDSSLRTTYWLSDPQDAINW